MEVQQVNKIKNIAFWVMIIFVFALGVYLINYIKSDSYACINSPLTYGYNHLTSTNDAPISCSCTFTGATEKLSFNSSGVYITKDLLNNNNNILPLKDQLLLNYSN